MAHVKADKKLNGWCIGAFFKDGAAVTTDPASLAFFRAAEGFTVTDPKHVEKDEKDDAKP